MGELVGDGSLPVGQSVARMGSLDDLGEGGGVHVGQWQAGEPQGEDLAEAARRQEAVAGRSDVGLRYDAASAGVPGGCHGSFEEPRADVLPSLGGMDLESQFGQVLLSGIGEQAQKGRPERDGGGVGRQPDERPAARPVVGVGQWGDAKRQGVSVVRRWQGLVRGLNCWALLRMCSTPPRRRCRSGDNANGSENLVGPSLLGKGIPEGPVAQRPRA